MIISKDFSIYKTEYFYVEIGGEKYVRKKKTYILIECFGMMMIFLELQT